MPPSPTLPRPSNQPRDVIVAKASDAIDQNGGSTLARVFYKYDCAGCKRRVTVATPNVLPARAKCGACAAWTDVNAGGFLIHMRRSVGVAWDTPALYFRKLYEHVPEAAVASEWEA